MLHVIKQPMVLGENTYFPHGGGVGLHVKQAAYTNQFHTGH